MKIEDLFSTEAETAVLSLVLQHPDLVLELQTVKPFMFSSSPNQTIYSAVLELTEQNLVPSPSMLESYLRSRRLLEPDGGKEYLTYLSKQTFEAANASFFQDMLVNSYKSRVLVSLSNRVGEKVMSSHEKADDVIEDVRKTLDALSETSGGEATSSLTDVLKDSWTDIEERAKNPGIRGVTSGIRDLDISTSGLNEGDLWIIAGRPGMGKTAHMCNMMLNQAKQGIPTMMFSFEMNKKVLAERLIALESGINSFNIRIGTLSKKELETISTSIRQIKSIPLYIDSNFSGDINYIVNTARRYVRTSGVKVCYLDYIQLLGKRDADSTNELGRISRMLKLSAEELGITWVAGSQFNRLLELRDDKRPILSDLRQSGNIEEDADVVVGMYRHEKYDKNTPDRGVLEDIVLKQRSGPTGTLFLNFDESTGRIINR